MRFHFSKTVVNYLNKTLTNKQIAFMVFSSIVGYEIISLPQIFATFSGTSGWLLIIIGDIVILFYAYIFIYLAKTFTHKTIFEYGQILVGKSMTLFIILMIMIYSIGSVSILTRLSSETIKLSLLINTPTWALSALMLLASFYTLSNGIRAIGRIFEIFSIIIIISALAINFGIFSQGDFTNLKPIIVLDELDISFKSFNHILFPFLGIEILAVLPMNIKKQNKNILRYIALIVIFIGILYILVIEACISVMGVESIVHYEASLFATVRRIELDALQFLKRLDSVFIFSSILAIYTTIVSSLYIVVFFISKLFPNVNRRIIVFIITLVCYIIGLIPKTMDSLRLIFDYSGYLGVMIILIIPLILFLLTLIKKHDKKL